MKQIPLTQGLFALVDDADYDFLSQWRWYAVRMGRSIYAVRKRRLSDGPGPSNIQMHRVILCPPDHLEIDHVNGDGWDNRRANLRTVTSGINQANQVHRKRNRKHDLPMGVYPTGKRFWSQIKINRHFHHLGTFDTPKEAHAAYMTARMQRLSERRLRA